MGRGWSTFLVAAALVTTLVQAERKALSPDFVRKYWLKDSSHVANIVSKQTSYLLFFTSWSECAVDNNDDDGEGRDGDEHWYAYRTQDFCANTAFSLYGIPKHHVSPIHHCARGNYINSFFTYGSADVLLEAIGKSPDVYYKDYSSNNNNNQNNNNNGQDNYANGYNKVTNGNCVVLDEGDRRERALEEMMQRDLNSQEDDNYDYYDSEYLQGTSSTMGCTADGHFAIATFQGQACDGNYFLGTIDKMRSYNRQYRHLHCHRIWGRSFGNEAAATSLMLNSWPCDIDLYPNSCPDPYGIKQRSANALRAAAHGQNPKLAVWNGRVKRPLRIISWICFLVGMGLVYFGYSIKNKGRIEAKGGGVKGFLRTMMSDYRHNRRQRQLEREMMMSQDEDEYDSSPRKSKSSRETSRRKKKRKKRRKSGTRSSSGRSERTAEGHIEMGEFPGDESGIMA